MARDMMDTLACSYCGTVATEGTMRCGRLGAFNTLQGCAVLLQILRNRFWISGYLSGVKG